MPSTHHSILQPSSSASSSLPSSTALSFALSIPLIRDEIAASLFPSDLLACCLVSHLFHGAFTPILWQDVLLANQRAVTLFQSSSISSFSPYQTLARNADHIRSIRSFFCYAFESLASQEPFRNLQTLDTLASELHNKGIVDYTNTQRLLLFVKVNTSLRDLTLSNFPLESEKTTRLLGQVLEDHKGLMRVKMTSFRDVDIKSLQHVLRGAIKGASTGRLQKLSITCLGRDVGGQEVMRRMISTITNGNSNSNDSNANNEVETKTYQLLQNEGEEEGKRPISATRLKELMIHANLYRVFQYTLLPMLMHCSNLERLYIPLIDVGQWFTELCRTLREHCPRLQYVEGGFLHARDEHLAMLLRSVQDLRGYCMESGQWMGPLSIHALLGEKHSADLSQQQHHDHHRYCHTLERLSIKTCYGITSKHLQLILTSCPNLKVFEALSAADRQNFYSPRLDIRDLPVQTHIKTEMWTEPGAMPKIELGRPSWVCKGLRELHIGFTGFSSFSSPEETGLVKLFVDHIYDQLALLTELRTLHLAGELGRTVFPAYSNVWAFDFTIRSGLAKLEALKELRVLSVQKLKHRRFGREEVQWMTGSGAEPEVGTGPGARIGAQLRSAKIWPKLEVFTTSYPRQAVMSLADEAENGTQSEGGEWSGVLNPSIDELARLRPSLVVTIVRDCGTTN
ncbi:hypothetical protein EDD11_008657 [Mortierella claussenii]|nr:hypothetical protein EDD11_008657 [Mortierella claussenii]